MRLTRAGEYGVRCMLYLASQEAGSIINRKIISQYMNIPDQFLGKVAQQLARAGLIDIVQGARGGYRLRTSPSQITLLAVVEAVIGEIFLNDCLMSPTSCSRSPSCSVNRIWEKTKNQMRETLRGVTFDQLLKDESCLFPYC